LIACSSISCEDDTFSSSSFISFSIIFINIPKLCYSNSIFKFLNIILRHYLTLSFVWYFLSNIHLQILFFHLFLLVFLDLLCLLLSFQFYHQFVFLHWILNIWRQSFTASYILISSFLLSRVNSYSLMSASLNPVHHSYSIK
jgi:hypothetical protein